MRIHRKRRKKRKIKDEQPGKDGVGGYERRKRNSKGGYEEKTEKHQR